jgi:hypothetical protein
MNGQASFEAVRDTIRHGLHSRSPDQFPYGTRGTLEFVLYDKEDTPKSTCNWLGSLEHGTHEICPQCFSAMMQPVSFKTVPSVLVFEINTRNINVSKTLRFEQEGKTVILNVRGLIYHGDFHFTSRIIGTNGMITGSNCKNDGDFNKFSSNMLLNCRGKKLILVMYARV